MRNIATCYSEHAVKVSNSYCSGPSNRVSVSNSLTPSIQNAVTCIYRAKLAATQKQFFVRITWSDPVGSGFYIGVADDDTRFSRNSRQLLQKIKGSKTFECCNSKVDVLWDLSQAIYNVGLEPVSGFYVMVFVNSDVILFLGETEEPELKKQIKGYPKVPKFSLISRIEHFSGNALYSTKVKFCDTGTWHDILIKCIDGSGSEKSMLSVSIDKKDVIQVKRLKWNFRGNQTIFVDKIQVDMMWDVHDWFFNPTKHEYANAIFMFKTRTGFDGRLWLEEKILEDKVGFSLLVCGCRNSK